MFRITALPPEREQDGVDGNGNPLPPVVAWEHGLVFADAEAFSSDAPNNVLKADTFEFPSDMPNADMHKAINDHFKRMADAATRREELLPFVGQSFQIT